MGVLQCGTKRRNTGRKTCLALTGDSGGHGPGFSHSTTSISPPSHLASLPPSASTTKEILKSDIKQIFGEQDSVLVT